MALGDMDKAKSSLLVAHGQYKSDLRIKESKTPTLQSQESKNLGNLDTLVESDDDNGEDEDEEKGEVNSLEAQCKLRRQESNLVSAEMYEKEMFGEETFENWDFATQKEYSCRQQFMPALVRDMQLDHFIFTFFSGFT